MLKKTLLLNIKVGPDLMMHPIPPGTGTDPNASLVLHRPLLERWQSACGSSVLSSTSLTDLSARRKFKDWDGIFTEEVFIMGLWVMIVQNVMQWLSHELSVMDFCKKIFIKHNYCELLMF